MSTGEKERNKALACERKISEKKLYIEGRSEVEVACGRKARKEREREILIEKRRKKGRSDGV